MKPFKVCLMAGALAAGMYAQTAAQLPKGDVARGKAAFQQCQLCHDPDAWRTGGLLARKGGPPLRKLYSKSHLATTGKPVNDDTVLEVINNGGKGMVPFRDTLNAQQKADLIAYIKSQ